MNLIYKLGDNSVISHLGNLPTLGVLITVLACLLCLSWEYIRMQPDGRWVSYAVIARRAAVILTVIAFLLIGCHFATVWALFNSY